MKVDLRKVNLKKSATWNIWKQLNIDLDTYNGRKVHVSKKYIPEVEQQKLIDYMLKNYKKLTYYKGYRVSKEYIKKKISWEYLSYFPRGTK